MYYGWYAIKLNQIKPNKIYNNLYVSNCYNLMNNN